MYVILLQLEIEKCGCNSRCFYHPGDKHLTNLDDVPPQQLPCTIYNTIKFTQENISVIRQKQFKQDS